MFAARGLAVSMSVFVIVYGVLSLAVCFSWRRVWRYSQRHPASWIANLLFALRMFPLAAAAAITIAVTVPSFLWLEPRAIDEPTGGIALVLSLCGAGLGMIGLLNMGMAVHRAARAISLWTHAAQPVEATQVKPTEDLPVLRISRPVPALVTAGIVRPRIILSDAAESALTAGELQAALQHEVAHVRRRDNLKRLLLRLVPFPGMSALEAAWAEAAEMAADEAAVSNPAEALDLAAALIKLSRLAPACQPSDLTAALLHGHGLDERGLDDHGPGSAVGARVERLLSWNDWRNRPLRKYSPWYGLAAAVATVAVFSVTYSQLLVHVHTATEWLVR
ncbi:MAG: M56 family metallopeptidase [Candidatus Sulfotelmatobacter sp.]